MSLFIQDLNPHYYGWKPTYVDYIQTDGTCCFRTGITATKGMKVSLTIQSLINNTAINKPLICFYYPETTLYNGIYNGESGGTYAFCIAGNYTNKILLTPPTTNKYHCVCSIDNDAHLVVDSISTDNGSLLGEISLLGNSNPSRYLTGRIYGVQIYNASGNLISNLRPAIDLSINQACLWDDVRKLFIYRTGGNACTYGQSFTNSEYLESSGTQWINTGILIPSLQNFKVDMEAMMTATNAARQCIAGYDSGAQIALNGDTTVWSVEVTSSSVNAMRPTHLVGTWNSNTFYLQIADSVTISRGIGSAANYAANSTYPLFTARTGSGSLYYLSKGARIYWCQLWQNGVIIKDYVPVSKISDRTFQFWDYVMGEFTTNAGTGLFIGNYM